MKKANPFRLRRNRRTEWRLSFVMLVAFMGSWTFQCMCGPNCGADNVNRVSAAPLIADSGCCSSCAPVEKSRSPEQSKNDCSCCINEMQDLELTEILCEAGRTAPENTPVLVKVMPWLTAPRPLIWVVEKRPPPGGPPAYIRFENLLI